MQRVLTALFLVQISGMVLGRSDPDCRCDICNYCDVKLELGIVLDSSTSISKEDFEKGQKFLIDYLKKFNINQGAVRVSIITYGSSPHQKDAFYLNTFNNGTDVAKAISKIKHQEGDTATGDAIKFMRENQLALRFTRSGVPRVSVVITDGNSQRKTKTEAEALKAREDGIIMFAVGVGSQIDYNELENIAGRSDYVETVDSYERLATIIDELVKKTCVKREV